MICDPQIYNNITELIGKTPLVRLSRMTDGIDSFVLAKIEGVNPGGSIKDRIALGMIKAAQNEGKITPGISTIIEPTSGNTGIGLAMVGAVWGYKVIIIMPDTVNVERIQILKLLGARVILTPGVDGIQGAIDEALRLLDEVPESFMPNQFKNPENPRTHLLTTAEEILNDTKQEIDIFVAGVGTGGTISGVASALKEKIPQLFAVAVEPAGSPVISGGKPGKHAIYGIGAGFIPDVLDTNIIDEVITVTDEDAFETARRLSREEGILSGISSGANVWAALKIAERVENSGKVIVVILPDSGERYLSTELIRGLNDFGGGS